MIELQVAGYIGRDAEVRTIESGDTAISFSVAHTDRYKSKAGEVNERTTWVKCTLWKRKGESLKVAEYLGKGTLVFVSGQPSARAWNGDDNRARAGMELNVKRLEFLGGAKKNDNTEAPKDNENEFDLPDDMVKDLPF